MSGSLEDTSGGAVPAAVLQLQGGALTHPFVERSTSVGEFHFQAVPPGDYRLSVLAEGFAPYQCSVRVGSRPPSPLRITLGLATLHQALDVNGEEQQLNTQADGNRSTLAASERALKELPLFDNDYLATMSRFLDPGAIGAAGAGTVVDGMAGPLSGIPRSAIKEVKVNNDTYSALFAEPGRGRIEIITKDLGSALHGTASVLVRDYRLNARDAFALERPNEQRGIYEASLMGPFGPGSRNGFQVSIERDIQDQVAVVYAQTPQGFVHDNVPAPERRLWATGRFNHKFSDSNSFWIGYEHDSGSERNQGVGGTVLPETGFNGSYFWNELLVSQRTVLTPHLTHALQGWAGTVSWWTGSTLAAPRISVLGAFTGGGAQADQLHTLTYGVISEVLTWSHGKHTVSFGISVPELDRAGFTKRQNLLGTYVFSSLADYAARHPLSFTWQSGSGHAAPVLAVISGYVQDEVQLRPGLSLSMGLRYYWQNRISSEASNLAPRVSFAYAPWRGRKIVLRSGAGLFYDRLDRASAADVDLYSRQGLVKHTADAPDYPVTTAQRLVAPDSLRLDPRLRTPRSLHYSLGLEFQLAKSATLATSYVGSRGYNLFQSRDVNAPLPPGFPVRPDPARGQIREIESDGRQRNNSLEVVLRGQVTKRLSGMAQYNLGHVTNNTDGINSFPASSWDLNGEWARASFDTRHRFNLLASFDGGRWLKFGAGVILSSGLPINVTTGIDANHDGLANDRPPGLARNSMQGPDRAEFDLRWSRSFSLEHSLRKGASATLAVDAFNVLNRVNYSTYVGVLTSPFFGQPVASRPARRMQANLRFEF